MPRHCLILLLSVFASTTLGDEFAYQNIGMGGGGGMFTPAMSPVDHDFMLISSDMSGCYRSHDGGKSWRMIPYKFISGAIGCKPFFHPTDARIVVWSDRLTTDKAKSWHPICKENAPWGTDTVTHVACLGNLTVYVGAKSGVWRGNDKGRTWKQLAKGPCGGIAVTADNTVYFAAGSELYQTAPRSGAAAQRKPARIEGAIHAVAAAGQDDNQTIHLATASGLYTSRDSGQTWRQTRPGQIADVVMAVNQTDTAYCCDRQKIFATVDGGRSWNSCFRMKENVTPSWVQTELYWGYYIVHNGLNVCPNDPSIVMMSTQGDFYISRDGGGRWRPIMNRRVGRAPGGGKGGRFRPIGLEVTSCWDYYFDPHDPNRHYIAYTDIGFAYSVDRGTTWSYGGKGSPWSNTFYDIAFDPLVKEKIYAACSSKHDIPHWTHVDSNYRPGGVCVSTDHGVTWRASSNGLPKLPACGIAVDPKSTADHTVLYVTMYGDGVYKSTDGGRNWRKKPGVGREGNRHVYQIIAHEKTGDLYVGVTGNRQGNQFPVAGGLWKSSDGGDTWTELTKGLKLGWPTGFAVHPADPNIIYLAACSWPWPGSDQGGIYKTSDGGRTWEHLLKNKDFGKYVHAMFVTLHPDDPDVVYLGTIRGLWASANAGRGWQELDQIPFRVAHRVRIDPHDRGTMYITTFGGGVWRGPAWTGQVKKISAQTATRKQRR